MKPYWPEIKELSELVIALGDKINDVSWVLTEDAVEEEKKRAQEKEKALQQEPQEDTGFAAPSTAAAAPANVLQVKKRGKSAQTTSAPSENSTSV